MKIAVPLGLGTLALLVCLLSVHLAAPPPVTLPASTAEPVTLGIAAPVAVVELFTSEGCSSCPPADRFIPDLAERTDPRLPSLAFHVDYWSRLDWRDPFSSAAYSQRQRAYANVFGSGRVYTLQMVLNGRHDAEQVIHRAREQSAPATVAATAHADGRTAAVDYAVPGAPDGAVLHLALVQRQAPQAVPRRENAGQTLRDANVVRAFETVSAGEGTRPLALPSENAVAAGYVQNPGTMRVFGAAEAAVSK